MDTLAKVTIPCNVCVGPKLPHKNRLFIYFPVSSFKMLRTTTAFCAIALAAAAPSGLPTKLAAFMARAEADPAGVAKQLREEFAGTVATPIGKFQNIAGILP